MKEFDVDKASGFKTTTYRQLSLYLDIMYEIHYNSNAEWGTGIMMDEPWCLFYRSVARRSDIMSKPVFITVWLLCMILSAGIGDALAEPINVCGIICDTQAVSIDLGENLVEDIQQLVQALDQMPNLTQVDMYNSKLNKENMAYLSERYPNITFGWTIHIWEHVIRTDQTAFSTLHGSSPNPPHTEKDFDVLKYCKKLKALDLGHNWIDDISFLNDLPDLEVLILGRNQIHDISPIANLHHLVYLELFSNHIKDVSPLAGLTSLRDLNLSNNPILDLSPLMDMKWLDRLWLGKFMNYPEEQKKEILAALPDCEFFWDWGPTAGTWREHPHYFALYDFFRTTVYVPFEE
ncbi:MAG: leucine-rich repeat domain-containing protein [Clostridia bacterium]|nr:leucine-rich repeat domain-containing protein [Clostridia bacterium]